MTPPFIQTELELLVLHLVLSLHIPPLWDSFLYTKPPNKSSTGRMCGSDRLEAMIMLLCNISWRGKKREAPSVIEGMRPPRL